MLATWPRAAAVAALTVSLTAALCAAPAAPRSAAAAVPAPTSTPVIMLHGYSSGTCPGIDVGGDDFGYLYWKLLENGWSAATLLPASFYACDTDGVDITGYGPQVPDGATPTISAGHPRVAYDQRTPIEQLAHDLAWFVYDTYTSAGTPVDLIGASMGGLIVRDALYRVRAGDPTFPPELLVTQAVSISVPNAGYGTLSRPSSLCGATVECEELATDAPFMTDLIAHAPDPQGAGGTAWSAIGSSAGCDAVPIASSLALPEAERVDFQTPCYAHAGYLWDYSDAADAVAALSPPEQGAVRVTDAPHSLDWILDRLRTPDVAPDPPAVWLGLLPAVRATLAISLAVSASDGGGGVSSVDVRYRPRGWDATFGGYVYPAGWQGSAPTILTLDGLAAHEYCFSARARSTDGVTSPWSADECTSIPVDDRSLTAVTAGWRRVSTSPAYLNTLTTTSRAGATLRLVGVRGSRLTLVVATCPTCGSLAITLDGRAWRTVSTAAARAQRMVLVPLPAFSIAGPVTVGITALQGRPVWIDGLAVG